MTKLLLVLMTFVVTVSYAQDAGSDDAAIVQSIITASGLSGATVQDVAVMEGGRVVSLDLKNRDISKDGISMIPQDIIKLTALRSFSCNGNIVDSLPSDIGLLVNLEKIDCGNNRIAALPPSIGALKNLTHLDMRYNRLTALPPELAGCSKLALLQLWGNKLTVLDETITKIPALKEVYLKDNRLTMLPAGIVRIKYGYIDFIGNKLCNLSAPLDAWAKKVDKRYKETQKCW